MEFMKKALAEAKNSAGEITVGAVVVKDNKIIFSASNKKEVLNDVTAHAEILAIRGAEEKLGNWRLEDCELYVTLEPCPMCAWAILQARVKAVYFGSYDRNYGALGSAIDLRTCANSKLKVYGGILEEECDALLRSCFMEMRDESLRH